MLGMETKGKYIGYIRVSTKGQADSGLSLEAQEQKIRAYAAVYDIDVVRIERHEYQFLYEDDMGMHFMHNETYEQTMMQPDFVSGREFVKEGEVVEILLNASTFEPVRVEIAKHVELAITRTDPGFKGDTVQGGTKEATLESGAVVQVPLFINEGDVIRVDTESRSYITRVTK